MSQFRKGVDRRGNEFLVAGVEGDEVGRITSLRSSERPPGASDEWNGGPVGLTIPDQLVIVKPVRVSDDDPGSEPDRIRFELAHGLLDPESAFEFDFVETGVEHRYVGMITRRDKLSELKSSHGFDDPSQAADIRCRARAVAVANGYLGFCQPVDAELVALVDVCDDRASVALVYRKRLIDVASLHFDLTDSDTARAVDRFAVDLKTVLNFRLASVLDGGLGTPLGSLQVWGDRVDDRFREMMAGYFPVRPGSPEIDRTLIGDELKMEPADIPRYLAALGLTVN